MAAAIDRLQYLGMQVFINDLACISKDEYKQYKFPKSKKSRIRRKWAKRSINYKWVEKHRAFQIGDKWYVSTKIYNQLLKQFK